MQRRTFDDVVVGQGLAGTTLAWQLRYSGRSVLTIERDTAFASSAVAAGLMTPVTGQRLAVAWRWDELWPAACNFYERVEEDTGTGFLTRQSMLRLFAGCEERTLYESRQSRLGELVRSPRPGVDSTCFHAPHGCFEMPSAGHLNVQKYLQVSKAHFIADGKYCTATIDPCRDVVLTPNAVELPRFNVRAQRLIWCQGIDGLANPEFAAVDFNPAKGEILRLRIPALTEQRIIHGGVCLIPLGDDSFLAGSTYDWNSVDGVPTCAGRDEIARRLTAFLKPPFQIIGHTAAVRPILRDFRPVAGVHPQHSQLAVFNGLGSKGALYAPGLAERLVGSFDDGPAIDTEVSIRRWLRSDSESDPTSMQLSKPPRLTELAHRMIQPRLHPGDYAVDATAGNGSDTAFLASALGPEGHVVAVDIQEAALQRTSDRLRQLGLRNVTLVHADHADLADVLPPEMHGRIGAVMFNLGYLPGGDHSVITQPSSTRRALRSALETLKPGGILTVVAYPGHGGGDTETAMVEKLLRELADEDWEFGESTGAGISCPRLLWASRRQAL